MRTRVDNVRRSWRRSVWFFRLFPFWIGLIVAINFWDDHANGKPFNWTNLWIGLGFLVFAGVLFVISRLVYKIGLRYAKHRDNKAP